MKKKPLKIISLFAGAGGMDLGFKNAGFDIMWANDFDPDSVKTYRRNFGDHIVLGDIEKIRGVSLNPNSLKQLIEREWVDIIGQKEVPGRPSLYATTKYFLDDFGLKTLAQLPEFKDLEQSPLNQTVDNESPEPNVQEVSDLKEEE